MLTAEAGRQLVVNIVHIYLHTSSAQETLFQLLLVTSLMAADMKRGLTCLGLSEGQARVLWELGALGAEQPSTQRQLADILKVSLRNVTALIEAMETTGFVRRAALTSRTGEPSPSC